MRYILLILLLIALGYAMALVWLNHMDVAVDLWFNQIPTIRLGLLLFITVLLGIVIGLLLGLQIYRVFQKSWEIKRLKQEIEALKKVQLDEVATKALNYARDHVDVNDSVSDLNHNPQTSNLDKAP